MRHRPLGDDLFTVSDGEEMERREEGRRRRRRRKEREMEDGGPIEIYENLEWIKMNHKTKWIVREIWVKYVKSSLKWSNFSARRGLELHNGYGGVREHRLAIFPLKIYSFFPIVRYACAKRWPESQTVVVDFVCAHTSNVRHFYRTRGQFQREQALRLTSLNICLALLGYG